MRSVLSVTLFYACADGARGGGGGGGGAVRELDKPQMCNDIPVTSLSTVNCRVADGNVIYKTANHQG